MLPLAAASSISAATAKSGSRRCLALADNACLLEAQRAGIPALSPTSMTSIPVTAAPVAAAPVTAAPAPVVTAAPIATMPATAPAPMAAPAAMIPADLFRLQMFHLVPGGDGGEGNLVGARG